MRAQRWAWKLEAAPDGQAELPGAVQDGIRDGAAAVAPAVSRAADNLAPTAGFRERCAAEAWFVVEALGAPRALAKA